MGVPGITPRIDLLRGCALFSRLETEQLAVLAQELRPVRYRRNEIIFLKNDPGDAMYIIQRGRVKISVLNGDGKDLIINIYGPGEVFGEMAVFDGLARSATATAAEIVEALCLSQSSFERLLAAVPGLAASIIALLSRRLRYTTAQTELLGLFGGYDRVAMKLLQVVEASGGGLPCVISLSQQDLAAMLGLTREWLNKVLKTFADEGLIELSWGKVTVLNSQALREWT
jgi:CRP/FNR family transcriptional regulator/CRP/FNR family cyclic AMP-dependent transcriptional regulator